MQNTQNIERLTKAKHTADFLVSELRELYVKASPMLSLLITPELELAVKISRQLNAILETVNTETILNE